MSKINVSGLISYKEKNNYSPIGFLVSDLDIIIFNKNNIFNENSNNYIATKLKNNMEVDNDLIYNSNRIEVDSTKKIIEKLFISVKNASLNDVKVNGNTILKNEESMIIFFNKEFFLDNMAKNRFNIEEGNLICFSVDNQPISKKEALNYFDRIYMSMINVNNNFEVSENILEWNILAGKELLKMVRLDAIYGVRKYNETWNGFEALQSNIVLKNLLELGMLQEAYFVLCQLPDGNKETDFFYRERIEKYKLCLITSMVEPMD